MDAVVLSVFEKARAPAELAAYTLKIAQESHGRERLAHELRDVYQTLPFSPDADMCRVLQLTEFLVEVCDGLPPDLKLILQQFNRFYMWLHEYDWCHPHDLQVANKLNLILGTTRQELQEGDWRY
jgi:hypothetical protein